MLVDDEMAELSTASVDSAHLLRQLSGEFSLAGTLRPRRRALKLELHRAAVPLRCDR